MNTIPTEAVGLTCDAEPWNFVFDPKRTALLVIDMQNDFCARGGYCDTYMTKRADGRGAVDLLREPIAAISNVLSASRESGVLVIYTVEAHMPDLSDAPKNKRDATEKVGALIGSEGPLGRLLIRGERGTEVIPELTPQSGERVLHKPGKGAFFATDLDHILRVAGITHLVLTGVTTDCCVLGTRMEARDRGYHTVQLEDCCAASKRENHDAVFNMIRTHPEAFGTMASSESFIKALATC